MTYASPEIRIERSRFLKLLQYQLYSSVTLVGAGALVFIVSILSPSFFKYPYFYFGGWSAVLAFWPLFLWGITATIIFNWEASSTLSPSESTEVLGYGLTTSVLAGVWEEIGYRWLYICLAMVVTWALNWVWSSGVGILFIFLGLVAAWALWIDGKKVIACFLSVWATVMGVGSYYVEIIYYIREWWVWFADLLTLYQMHDALKNPDRLFIFGVLLANLWFRNGHRYQGIVGIVNSWFCGMVFIYAMLTYGLWTAIIIHVLYDILIEFTCYIWRLVR